MYKKFNDDNYLETWETHENYKIQYIDLKKDAQDRLGVSHGHYGFHAFIGSPISAFDGWGETPEEARKELLRHVEESLEYHEEQAKILKQIIVENL